MDSGFADICKQLESKYDVVGMIDLTGIAAPDWIDMQEKLYNLKKDKFNDDQRLLILLDRDWYRGDNGCGSLFESLQRQINDIDISNFFVIVVTTNPQVDFESQWLHDNVSRDPVPITIIQCPGDYIRLSSLQQTEFDLSQSQRDSIEALQKLNDDQKKLLKSANFCMAPWTHLYVRTSKKVRLCCASDQDIGDVAQSDLSAIWNSEPLREVRKSMLNNIPHPACQVCHKNQSLGKSTYRTYINRQMLKHVSRVDSTGSDGSLDQFQLNFLHFEFNNLCNLTCRMCDSRYSSSWHKIETDLGRIPINTSALVSANDDGKLMEQFKPHLPYVDLIKFTGGEPLMMQEFYDVLDELMQQSRTDIELFYNTNLTTTKYRGRSIFDLWKNFSKITVGASIDAMGPRAEYLRPGKPWALILENRKRMIEECPHVDFFISATATILNAWHLPDLHRDWVEQGLIEPGNFDLNLLQAPAHLRLHRAPLLLKQELKSRYREHLRWLRPLDTSGRSVRAFEFLLSLLEENEEFDANDFWHNVNALDKYHNTSLLSVFPELACLPKCD